MLGNIWLSSALIVIAIFSAGAAYKSYSDIEAAKQIQEHYKIVSQIKTLIAKQYNKNPADITRDEIIAHLPLGENWEKVLLLDRDKDSHLSNKELVVQVTETVDDKEKERAKIRISQDEKLKLFALRAKLQDTIDIKNVTPVDGKYIYDIGKNNKNEIIKDMEIQKAIKKAISYMISEVVYGTNTDYSNLLTNIKSNFTPIDNIYQELRTQSEISSNITLTKDVLLTRRKDYFQSKIKEQLLKNESSEETRLYYLMKDVL